MHTPLKFFIAAAIGFAMGTAWVTFAQQDQRSQCRNLSASSESSRLSLDMRNANDRGWNVVDVEREPDGSWLVVYENCTNGD